jgi:hypothetical protein
MRVSRFVRCSALGVALIASTGCSPGARSESGAPHVRRDSGAIDAGPDPKDRDANGVVDVDADTPIDAGSVPDHDASDTVRDSGRVDAGLGAGHVDAGSPALQQRIDAAAESIRSDTCFAQEDTSLCQWADYEVGPAQFTMARSTGEAVLVIDDFGAGLFPEFVRYRNRMLGFYRINGERLEVETLSVHLPRRLGDVLVSFAGPEFIPAGALAQLVAPVGQTYGKLDLLYYGHGGVVFTHLVDLVPEQPLVLLDLTHLLEIPSVVCQGIDPRTLATAAAHGTAVAASLKQVMTDNNVRFVNASFGSTVQTLATEWPRTCGGAVPSNEQLRQLLHVYDPIYDVLFNSDGVIAAHASAQLGSPADFPFDQPNAQFPNRVRVGFISSSSSGLDEAGRGTVNKTEQFPADGDADVFLDWGCEGIDLCADPHYQLVAGYGLGVGTVAFMSSSYVNPLGLARLVNLRYANHAREPMSNTLVQTLKRELTPSLCGPGGDQPCTYQDPIAHRQLEPFRLHYE